MFASLCFLFLILDISDQIRNDEVFHDFDCCNSTMCVLRKCGKKFKTTINIIYIIILKLLLESPHNGFIQ